MKELCIMAQELLPLFRDECVGEQTEQVIKEHLSKCESCKEKWEQCKREKNVTKQEIAEYKGTDIQILESQKFSVISKKLKKRKFIKFLVGLGTIMVVCLLCFVNFSIFTYKGEAMSPTLKNDANCLVLNTAYLFLKPQQGDMVLMRWKDFSNMRDIYRIVGTPGDEIKICSGHLWVNGVIDDRYEGIGEHGVYHGKQNKISLTVPENKYFFLGDNFSSSYDSRYSEVGLLDGEDIYGKVIGTIPRFQYS